MVAETWIHIKVIEGQALKSMDSNGYSDPYCVMKLKQKKGKDQKRQTNFIRKCINPVWNEQFSFWSSTSDPEAVLRMTVMDQNTYSRDKKIGEVLLSVAEMSEEPQDLWLTLCDSKGQKDETLGRINIKLFATAAEEVMVNGRLLTREQQMKIRANQALKDADIHTSRKATSVFIGTWNLGNAHPPSDLGPWLPSSGYDIIAVGTQECTFTPDTDLSGAPLHKSSEESWLGALSRHFDRAYRRVCYISLREIRLCVFVHSSRAAEVGRIQKDTVATGLGNVIGNKGGTIVSFTLGHSRLCFVNCHLAAHQDKTPQRNDDIRAIVKSVDQGKRSTDILSEFHHVFWFGDLNYRLDFTGSDGKTQGLHKSPSTALFQEMEGMTKQKRFAELLGSDQLRSEMKAGRALPGFFEGKITFPPTFKVCRNELLKYTHKRSPAYCDRVLWLPAPGQRVKQLSYTSINAIITSDHKPVSASFEIDALTLGEPVDPARGDCSLVFTDLACDHIDQHPGVELKFSAAFLDASATAPWTSRKRMNPIQLAYNNEHRIRDMVLLIRVLGTDGAIISRGLFSFHIVEQQDDDTTVCRVKTLLTRQGQSAGVLTGKATFSWGPLRGDIRELRSKRMAGMGQATGIDAFKQMAHKNLRAAGVKPASETGSSPASPSNTFSQLPSAASAASPLRMQKDSPKAKPPSNPASPGRPSTAPPQQARVSQSRASPTPPRWPRPPNMQRAPSIRNSQSLNIPTGSSNSTAGASPRRPAASSAATIKLEKKKSKGLFGRKKK